MGVGIGKDILSYRVRHDITQQQLAEMVGVRQQTIAEWERGGSKKRLLTMKRLFWILFRDPRL